MTATDADSVLRRARLAAACVLALAATGCLRVDVSEGGRVEVTPAGEPCLLFPAAEEQPERIASSCHLYTSSGIPAGVTLSATPDPGYTWTGWRGSLTCGTDPVCTLSVLGATRLEAVFEPVAQAHAFTPEAIHVGVDGVAYLTELAASTVHRYSLNKRRWLAPMAVPADTRFTAYAPDDHRLYLASANGPISAIDLAVSREPHPFVQRSVTNLGLAMAGAYLVAADTRSSGTHVTYSRDGVQLSSRSSRGSSNGMAWSAATSRLYYTDLVSLRSELIPQDTGVIAGGASTITWPYSSDYPLAIPLRASPADARVLSGSGDVYDGETLAREQSLAVRPIDTHWSDDGVLALVAGGAGAVLEQRAGDYRLLDTIPFPGAPLRILTRGTGYEIVTVDAGGPRFSMWRPSENADGDGDGVTFAADAFPLDPSASQDADADGTPDALDAFPLRSACRVAADAPGGICDAEALRPSYTPAAVAADASGVVYALSSAHKRIDRWAPDGQLLDPIWLAATPTTMTYQATWNRLVIANADRTITAVDLAQPPRERRFAAAPLPIRALASLGPVLLSISAGSKPWALSIDANGTELAERKPSIYPTSNAPSEFSSSPVAPRAYAASENYFTLLELDAQQGATARRFQPSQFAPVAVPVRVSPDGTRVFAGPSASYETKYHAQVATFAGTTAVDTAWLDDGLVTLESAAGAARLRQWGPTGLRFAEASFPGTPLRTLRSGNAVAVLTLEAGRVRHALYVPTPDADGDGVANAADGFPTDPAASVDADGDGWADAWNPGRGPADSTTGLAALDAFPDFRECWLPQHERNGTCDFGATLPAYTPSEIEIDRHGVVYLLSPQNRRIYRWSLEDAYHLEPIALSEPPVDFAYVLETDRLHVVYGDGRITSITPAEHPVEVAFATLPSEPFWLTAAGRFLFAAHRRDFTSAPPRRTLFDAGGSVVTSEPGQTSRQQTYSEAARGYFLTIPTSSTGLVWLALDPDTGAFGSARSSPFQGDYGILDPVRVSPDGTRVLVGTGDVYDAATLLIRESLPFLPTDAHWLAQGLLTIRAGTTGSTRLERWSDALALDDYLTVAGTPLRVLEADGRFVVVTLSGGRPALREYVPTDDADGDGVPNHDDGFPEDLAASADSDRDGWPDAWNPGRGPGDSTSGLALDAFPNDSACQTAAHGSGGLCDVAAATPAYRAEQVVEDVDGTIYLLNKTRGRIERYDPTTDTPMNPIVTDPQPTQLAYSRDLDRLYIGYANGAIDRVELGASDVPHRFTVVPGNLLDLEAAGDLLVAADYTSTDSTYIYSPSGAKITRLTLHLSFGGRFEWSSVGRRLYYFSGGNLEWLELLASGLPGVRDASAYRNFHTIPPIRASADGARVLLGGSHIHQGVTLELEHALGTTLTDATWIGDDLLTLEPDGTASLLRLRSRDYRVEVQASFPGEPIAVQEHDGVASVVTFAGGRTLITRFPILEDGDGDGVANVDDGFPIDPAASLDSDGDGWPDAWNDGYGPEDSTTGLALDAFPGAFGCQLPEQGLFGSCDVDWVLFPAPHVPLCVLGPTVPDEPSGWLSVEAIGETAPVCGGWMFVVPAAPAKRIELRNAFDGWRLGKVYPLPGSADDIELDFDNRRLYATLPDQHAVAVIDLGVAQTTQIVQLPEEPVQLAAGGDAGVFVSTHEVDYTPIGRVFRIAPGSATAEGGWPMPSLDIHGNPVRSELVISDTPYTPSYMNRYGFDPVTGLTLLQEVLTPTGRPLAISAAAGRIAAYGTGPNDGLDDLDAADPSHILGRWLTGWYPTAAAFSPDGTKLAASTSEQLVLFDVDTHDELDRAEFFACYLGGLLEVRYEPTGALAFARQTCDRDEDAYTMLHWLRVDP